MRGRARAAKFFKKCLTFFSIGIIITLEREVRKMFRIHGFILPNKEKGIIRLGRDIFKVIFRIGKWHLVYRLTDNGGTY